MNGSRSRTVLLVLPMLLASACVTINIYFPAAAAEKAADKIIDEVWQTQKSGDKGQKTEKATPPEPAAQPQK